MRRVTVILALLLALSAGGNIFLWDKSETAESIAETNARALEQIGASIGQDEAKRNFSAGLIRWYQFGNEGGVPSDKPARKLADIDVGLTPQYLHRYEKAFVSSYNKKMDELLDPKNPGNVARKG